MDKLTSTILDCAAGVGHWDDALDILGQTLGARGTGIQGSDASHSKRELLGLNELLRGEAKHIADTFLRGEDKGDTRLYQLFSAQPTNELFTEATLLGLTNNADLPASEFRDDLDEYGMGHRSIAVLNPTGPNFDLLVLLFENEAMQRAAFNVQEASFAVNLLSRSIALKRVMDSLRLRYQSALTALDHLGLGAILVNESAEVLLSNQEAQRIADTGDGLTIDQTGRLSTPDLVAKQVLLSSILDVVKTAKGENRVNRESFGLPRSGDAFDLLVSVSPLADAAMELEADLRCAFVLVIDPEKRGVLDASGLTLLGGLTVAETQIAESLLEGKRVNQIAEERDTSQHTVRGQVKSVAAKLRCRSQADIIRLAAATRLPFNDY